MAWLGDSYVELMGVFDEQLAGRSWWGRYVLDVLAGGEGWLGIALASDEVAGDAARLRAAGSTLGEAEPGSRLRPDGATVRWSLAHGEPDREIGLAFLIEHDTDAAEWTAAERAQRTAFEHPLGGAVRLVRVELPVADVRATTMRLHRELGLAFRPSLAGAGARETSLGSQALRLLRGSAATTPAIVVRGASEGSESELFGLRWVVQPVA